MPSIFSRIINREIPAHIILEDDRFIAFLDLMPLVTGHVLVVPKKEVDYIFDMEDADLQDMLVFAKKVAVGLRKAIECRRIGVSVIGLEVPHTHVHLVPMHTADDLNFTRPKLKPTPDELQATAAHIRSFF